MAVLTAGTGQYEYYDPGYSAYTIPNASSVPNNTVEGKEIVIPTVKPIPIKKNPTENPKGKMMNDIKYLKKSDDAFKYLERHFYDKSHHMVLYLLYKEKGKRYVFNVLHSLPNLTVRRKVDGNKKQDSVAISATWKGRKDHKIDSEDKDLSEILGDNENDNWDKVAGFKAYGYNKKKFMNSAGKKDILEENDYRCQSFICLNKPRQIYAYKWGFEIITDSVIDLLAIRLDFHGALERPKPGHLVATIEWFKEKIDMTLGREFIFPVKNNHVDNVTMIFDQNKKDNIDDWLFSEAVHNTVMDIGQKSKFNLDIS